MAFELQRRILALAIVPLLHGTLCGASETDSYTLRNQLEDSTEWMNRRMNKALDESAGKVHNCDPMALQTQLYKDWGGLFFAKIESWSKDNPKARFLPIEKSIYSEIAKVWGTHGLRKLTRFSAYYSPGMLRIGNAVIGDDKIGHFFQLGYSMYYAVQSKAHPGFKDIRNFRQKSAEAFVGDYDFIRKSNLTGEDLVLAFSEFQENTEWGMTATMVKSYGDMAANDAGFHFWSDLTEGTQPYLTCENNRWRRARNFQWQDYVTQAWDEAINCNDYDPKIEVAVRKQIRSRGIGECPISREACLNLKTQLGDRASRLLHPLCYKSGDEAVSNKDTK